VKYALCVLGDGVSVMPFSLYKKLNLNKLVPTEVSLQMIDKSTTIPICICEDVLIMIANVQIPTDSVILEMPKYDNLSISFGRPFVNTAGVVINYTESKVIVNVKWKDHTIYFPKRILVNHQRRVLMPLNQGFLQLEALKYPFLLKVINIK
jgi:hypothetical protein